MTEADISYLKEVQLAELLDGLVAKIIKDKPSAESLRPYIRDWAGGAEAAANGASDAAGGDGDAAPPKGLLMAFIKLQDGKKFMEDYMAHAGPLLERHGGKVVFYNSLSDPGTPPFPPAARTEASESKAWDTAAEYDLVCLVEFPTYEKALAFDADPDYVALVPDRDAAADAARVIFPAGPAYKTPGYAFAVFLTEPTDIERYTAEYAQFSGPSALKAGATLQACATAGEHPMFPTAGSATPRAKSYAIAILVGFEDEAAFKGWYDSDEYASIIPVRHELTKGMAAAVPCPQA